MSSGHSDTVCGGTLQRSPQERYCAAEVMGVFSSTSLPAADLSGGTGHPAPKCVRAGLSRI